MFPDPKLYDLNIPTDAYRRIQLEGIKKKIERTKLQQVVTQPMQFNPTSIVRGTPAYAMSLKQRQQAIKYQMSMQEQK